MAVVCAPFDLMELRRVLGSFVTGVTVITTLDGEGRPHGLTANSFSSVSLDPPLILWSQSCSAPSHAIFREAERFAVNILADHQMEVSNRFARPNADKFADIPVRGGLGGVPLLEGCAAHLECRRVHNYPGGDHMVFIGEVERVERHAHPPLVFGAGRYLVAQPHDLGPSLLDRQSTNIAKLKAVRVATRALAELADELDETLGLGIWGNHGPTIVRWEESSRPVSDNLRTGLVLPVLTSATGLAFAAWLPRAVTAPLIEAEMALGAGPGTNQDLTGLDKQLAGIRASGLARLIGTHAFADLYGGSISASSVPVFDAEGSMVLALTAIGTTDRMDLQDGARLPARLGDCARGLSVRLRVPGLSTANEAANEEGHEQ